MDTDKVNPASGSEVARGTLRVRSRKREDRTRAN